MEKLKIYLKDSDKARLADVRVRIVKDINPCEPCDNEDLVFEKAEDESLIPADALYKWKFDCNHEHEPIWFFTTAERCKQMVSPDKKDWTKKKLEEFARIEKKLYQDWWDGKVYGYVEEKWDNTDRRWKHISSCYGYYSTEAIVMAVKELIGKDKVIVCLDTEELKYDFDNAEKKPNEFK